MIEHEFQKEIDTFIKLNNRIINETYIEHGSMPPMLNMLAFSRAESCFVMIQGGASPDFLATQEGKDALADQVFPKMISEVNARGLTVVCTAFASESWLSVVTHKGSKMPTDQELHRMREEQKAERIEALLINYETALTSYAYFWKVEREDDKPVALTPFLENAKAGPDRGRFQGLLMNQPKQN